MLIEKLVCKALQSLRSKGVLCDVRLAGCDDESNILLAHSVLLAAHSRVFHELFKGSSEDIDSQETLSIDGLTYQMLNATLEFMYGHIPDNIVALTKGCRMLVVPAIEDYLKSIDEAGRYIKLFLSDRCFIL